MKAQLYKMTLYICDLEDSLSLDEIETLIEERALNGIAVNCICHFADRHIGKQVDWDDDIDLNQCNCPTSTWDKYFTPQTKPMTNADRIRAMSDEELADFITGRQTGGWCTDIGREMYYQHNLEWLKQPAEVE